MKKVSQVPKIKVNGIKILAVIATLLLLCLAFSTCSTKVTIKNPKQATLSFRDQNTDFTQPLTAEQTEEVAKLFTGKQYFGMEPKCPFNDNISIQIDNTVFAIGLDSCGVIRNSTNGKYFELSADEMEKIRQLFYPYGGSFEG